MKCTAYGFTICLMAHLSFFAADKPNNTQKASNEAVLVLQQFTKDLSEIATIDGNNIINPLMAGVQELVQRRSKCCSNHMIQIHTNLDITKKRFAEAAEKYNHIKTLFDEATAQFLACKEEDILTTAFQVALNGTKPMLQNLFMKETFDNENITKMLNMACSYGNVEIVEYLMQNQSITSAMSVQKMPTILDYLKDQDLSVIHKQELIMFKEAAIIRFEYLLHKNPDPQNIRKKCPFEECKRLIAEAINAQNTTSSGNKA